MGQTTTQTANLCADCAYARLDAALSPQEKRMVYRMCKTPGCPSWNKKNRLRTRAAVMEKRRYAS